MTTFLLQAIASLSIAGTNPTVSFTCRAEPLSRLLPELSQRCGWTLRVGDRCANDVMVISVKDVPVQELLYELAKVDAGQWKKTATDLELYPDPDARRFEARNYLNREASKMSALVGHGLRHFEQLACTPGHDAPFTPSQSFIERGITIYRLLKGLDPKWLVLEPGKSIKFADAPNAIEEPLPSSSREVLNWYTERYNARFEKKVGQSGETYGGYDMDDIADVQFGGSGVTRSKIDSHGKVTLALSRAETYLGIEAKVTFYDQNLRVATSFTQSISRPFEVEPGVPSDVVDQSQSVDQKIGVSPETALFTKLIFPRSDDLKSPVRVPRGLGALLAQPEVVDPLSFMPTDQLFGVATFQKAQLVASVPDDALSELSSLNSTKDVLDALSEGSVMTMDRSSGWLEIKPSNPQLSRRNRTDRAALRDLVRTCQKQGHLRLDQLAAFALHAPSPHEGGLTKAYQCYLDPSTGDAESYAMPSWNLLRFYGELSPSSRRLLTDGREVSMDSLSKTQIEAVRRLIFDPDGGFFFDELGIANMASNDSGMPSPRPNPESLAFGVPIHSFVKLSTRTELNVLPLCADDDGTELPQIMNLDQIVNWKFSEHHKFPHNDLFNVSRRRIDSVVLGTRTVFEFEFNFGDSLTMISQLFDDELSPNGQRFDINHLPPSAQTKIAEGVKSMIDMANRFENIQPSEQPSKVPPR